ncbi:MAG: hypothetical protein GX564_04725 [Oligosphaeraceae bacterium]|nr:hypothetical protein [Oligosphaeraceae bacterium]
MCVGQPPTCYIIAGPNGAGKTSFALRFLPQIAICQNFLNSDSIAAGISPLDSKAAIVPASKLFLQMISENIARRVDFAFETTLSGISFLPKIEAWRRDGWRVILYYLFIHSLEIATSRVAQRVAQGGHDVPPATIRRRYPRSVRNLFAFIPVCTEVHCFDNSETNPTLIFVADQLGLNIHNQKTFRLMQEI